MSVVCQVLKKKDLSALLHPKIYTVRVGVLTDVSQDLRR